VIIPDINILIHAYNTESLRHTSARKWWEDTLTCQRTVGMPWITILGFTRIMTHRGILKNPMFPAEATRRIRAWLASPRLHIISPGAAHAEIFFYLLEHLGTAGNLTTDAHLAALAIEFQAELASTDTDFARFPRLRWFNPVPDESPGHSRPQ
jgi:toxin-antitoxin system PIN domain toxin